VTLFGDQSPAVEAVVDAAGIDDLAALVLVNQPFDDDEEMARLDSQIEDRVAGAKVRDVDAVAHQSSLVRAETVEGRCRKVEGVSHGVQSDGAAHSITCAGIVNLPANAGVILGSHSPKALNRRKIGRLNPDQSAGVVSQALQR